MRKDFHQFYVFSGNGFIKVGITKNVVARLHKINHGTLPFEMRLELLVTGSRDGVSYLEAQALSQLPGRLRGEWFDASVLSATLATALIAGQVRGRPDGYRLRLFVDNAEEEAFRIDGIYRRRDRDAARKAHEILARECQKIDKGDLVAMSDADIRKVRNMNKYNMLKRKSRF